MTAPLFGLDGYHFLLAGCGLAIVVAYWLPRFISGREPAASALLILGGLLVFGLLPGVPEVFNPIERGALWEKVSEFAVIIALFGTGMRIDRVSDMGLWGSTVRLLAIAMPLCVAVMVVLGVVAGFSLAAAILLAAALAPTDPVLAADVQVGPPTEGGEHPIRFALTTEAGLNDGLAFPFVYLAIFVAAASGSGWLGEFVGFYVVYKIAVGIVAGLAAGWLLGRLLFGMPRGNPLAETGSGVVALAGVLLTYGMTELLEGYGFIAAFAMGLTLRRREAEHEFHVRLHSFSEALEHAATAILLVLLGGAIPALLPYLGWPQVLLGAALVFLVRPVSGMLALLGSRLSLPERGVVAFFGVRGIGSIYYLAYAAGAAEFAGLGALWATVAFTIVLSTVVHGLTAGLAIQMATHEKA